MEEEDTSHLTLGFVNVLRKLSLSHPLHHSPAFPPTSLAQQSAGSCRSTGFDLPESNITEALSCQEFIRISCGSDAVPWQSTKLPQDRYKRDPESWSTNRRGLSREDNTAARPTIKLFFEPSGTLFPFLEFKVPL